MSTTLDISRSTRESISSSFFADRPWSSHPSLLRHAFSKRLYWLDPGNVRKI